MYGKCVRMCIMLTLFVYMVRSFVLHFFENYSYLITPYMNVRCLHKDITGLFIASFPEYND